MRSLLFLFLLSSLMSYAQRDEYRRAFEKSLPTGLGQRLLLPQPGFLSYSIESSLARHTLRQRVNVISSDSLYRQIFWNYRFTKDSVRKYAPDKDSWHHQWMIQHLSDSIPNIDFSRKELVMYSACAQCLAYCSHGEDEYESCHRNGCDFHYAWFLRDKKDLEKETGPRKNFLEALYGYPPVPGAKPVQLNVTWRLLEGKILETGKFSSYLYVVDNDSLYEAIFKEAYRYGSEPMPVFDFSKQELLVRLACHQCLLYCSNSKDWSNTSCHPKRCVYNDTWYVRDKVLTGN